jgi:hypothetical protein
MATTVGLLHLKVHLPEAGSLKDKRRVLKSFKDRLRRRHNVSVAEVDGQDHWRWGVLAVAMAGADRRYLEGALQGILNGLKTHREMLLVDSEIEWL